MAAGGWKPLMSNVAAKIQLFFILQPFFKKLFHVAVVPLFSEPAPDERGGGNGGAQEGAPQREKFDADNDGGDYGHANGDDDDFLFHIVKILG